MKTIKRTLTVILSLLCLLVCLPAASAETAVWTGAWIEQSVATVPEVNAYIQAFDSNGEAVTDLSMSNVDIEAKLDDENLTVESFETVKDKGSMYIVLLNLANNSTSKEYLKSIKEQLTKWVDELNENDKLVLITYTKDYTVQLDGSESRESAKRIISYIETVYVNADTAPAIKEAIRIAGLEENQTPERRVAILIDNGEFLRNGDVINKELIESLNEARLPLYFICNNIYDEINDASGTFSISTGGISIAPYDKDDASIITYMRNRLNACYQLKLKGTSNAPEPKQRNLYIKLSAGDSFLEISRTTDVVGNIPDTEAPTVSNFEVEDNLTLKISFSEDVKGADKESSYTITEKKNGTELAIDSVEYNSISHTATLTMEAELAAGDYALEIKNVRDTSYEANSLKLDEGAAQIEFSIEGEGIPLYIIIGAAALVCIIIAVVIILVVKKKKRAEEQKKLEEEEKKKADDNHTGVPEWDKNAVNNLKYIENRGMQLPVSLSMVLPNGLMSKADVTVGQSFKVGRSKNKSDLSIADETISGTHISLSYSNGMLIISDAGSTNGTYVNGVKLVKPRPLNNGDTIMIGKTKITVKF